MKNVVKLLIILWMLQMPGFALAQTQEEGLAAKKIYMAAAACMAAYSNRTGSLAAAAFEQEGWKIETFRHADDKAESRYLLAWNVDSTQEKETFLLAVAGTENKADVKVDLRAQKVHFAGTTWDEFAANAARKDLPENVPRVHEGFNQVAQVLLANEKRLLSQILKERPADKLYLVGHSLGGAVVTLIAARLLDMGIDPGQIEVVTFGAPAIGNEEFEQKYDGKLNVTRIVIEGDPVPIALRRVFGGYRHIGREIRWKLPEPLIKRFSHDVPLYVDVATRNYLAKWQQAVDAGIISTPTASEGTPRIYVAPVKNRLPAGLQGEFRWMQSALLLEFGQMFPGFIRGRESDIQSHPLDVARDAGADILVIPEIQAIRVREENTWYVSLQQSVYRVDDGQMIHMAIYGGHTKFLTPLLGLIHAAKTMRAESNVWLSATPNKD